MKAYYRFIDHPDEEAVNIANILAPHRQRTTRRMQGQKAVLCVQDGCDLSQGAIEIWVIHAQEMNPAENVEAIEWFVLTTMDGSLAANAEQCLRWYCLRWRIEDWHRVMKSGCGIEDLGHATAERLKRAISINMVIAWRIMLMTLMGREYPELPAEVLFSDIEVRILQAYAKKIKK